MKNKIRPAIAVTAATPTTIPTIAPVDNPDEPFPSCPGFDAAASLLLLVDDAAVFVAELARLDDESLVPVLLVSEAPAVVSVKLLLAGSEIVSDEEISVVKLEVVPAGVVWELELVTVPVELLDVTLLASRTLNSPEYFEPVTPSCCKASE